METSTNHLQLKEKIEHGYKVWLARRAIRSSTTNRVIKRYYEAGTIFEPFAIKHNYKLNQEQAIEVFGPDITKMLENDIVLVE